MFLLKQGLVLSKETGKRLEAWAAGALQKEKLFEEHGVHFPSRNQSSCFLNFRRMTEGCQVDIVTHEQNNNLNTEKKDRPGSIIVSDTLRPAAHFGNRKCIQ